jgi:putative addiction module CopG family antidote
MNVTVSPDTQKLIEERMKAGGYTTPEEVIRAGLASLQQGETHGDFAPGELEQLLAQGERSIRERGTVTAAEVFGELRRRSEERRGGTP